MMRTAQADPSTKERLLNAAQTLMLAKGFSATTVDEICEAAKLTKGSFFHYFQSKDHLGRVLLERFCAAGQELQAGFCGKEEDPLKRVLGYVEATIKCCRDPAMSKGCLLGAFAQELSDTNPQIRSACAQGFERWARHFGGELAQAKAKYAPRAAFDPHAVAEHFIALLEGSLIMAKARKDSRLVERNLTQFRSYLKTLFKREER